MPTRKIEEDRECGRRRMCQHPEHNPPGMMVYTPGLWEHTCPGCGHVTKFRVNETSTVAYRWQREPR